jgi:uncharacterized membrane protein/ketosteroid isomerase-like protein
MLEIIPNWHPIFVHFTVALLSTSLLFYVASMVVASRRDAWVTVARWNLFAGLSFTLLTVATGLYAYGTVAHDAPSHAAMTDHRNWALLTAAFFFTVGGLGWWRLRTRPAPSLLFVGAMVIATGLLVTTAWKGGEVVYRYGLGVMSMPEAEDGHGHGDGGHDESTGADSGEGGDHDEATASAGGAAAEAAVLVPESDHSHDVEGILSGDDPEAVADLFSHVIQDGDEDAVLAIFAGDAFIFETGSAERSAVEYRDGHLPSDMAFLATMEIEQLERKSKLIGDAAWVSTLSRLSGTFRDTAVDLYSTESLVLERLDGLWRVTHVHWSSRPVSGGH